MRTRSERSLQLLGFGARLPSARSRPAPPGGRKRHANGLVSGRAALNARTWVGPAVAGYCEMTIWVVIVMVSDWCSAIMNWNGYETWTFAMQSGP